MTDETNNDTGLTGQGPFQNSRAHFEPLGFEAASDDQISGSDVADSLRGDPAAETMPGLPGALAFWRFDDGEDGSFSDSRGSAADAAIYQLVEGAAVAYASAPTRPGPDGSAGAAMDFNGEDSFGFIAHDPSMEVTQGTVALWVQPDRVEDCKQIFLSKDERGSGDGGHFRVGHDDEGRLFIRFAEGDGGGNKAWTSSQAYFTEGEWTHVAISFTDDGITAYVNGNAVPDYAWYREEGNLDSPADATEAYLLQNREPWLLGVDTSGSEVNDTP